METFKEHKYYSDYLISNYGRIKTKKRKVRYTHSVTGKEHFRTTEERFLKIYCNNQTGYKFVQLRKEKLVKNKTIHRLVAQTFLPIIIGRRYVNHKDGNKHNNVVDNLEWCTNKYNHQHAAETGLKANGETIGTSKLNIKCLVAIRKLISSGWKDGEIAGLFEVSRSNISHIRLGNTWKLTGEELTIKETVK